MLTVDTKQVVKVIWHKPHRRRRRTVKSYSPGGTNVPSHLGTLAPPGEYDLTCSCFVPVRVRSPNGKSIGLASRFCTAHNRVSSVRRRQLANTIEIVHIGTTWRIWLNWCFLRPIRVHNPNGKSIGPAVSAQLMAESLYSILYNRRR